MAWLYGHEPPPEMTENERVILSRMTDEFQGFHAFAADMKPASVSVALVRLRNRGLVESEKHGVVQLWRKCAQTG